MNIFFFSTIKSEISWIESDSTVRQALEKIDYHKYNVIPLLNNDGEYIGTLFDGDLLRFIKNDCDIDINKGENTKVKDIVRYRSYKALGIGSPIE